MRALATLKFTRKAVARDIEKVLRSAIANAQQKDGFGGDVDRLFVVGVLRRQGPSLKRVRPAPMGRAFRVVKRTAHLTVHVAERPARRGSRPPARGDEATRRASRRRSDQAGEARTSLWVRKFIPYGFRLGFNKTWRSRWFADKDYAKLLHEDLKLRDDLKKRFSARRRLARSRSSARPTS